MRTWQIGKSVDIVINDAGTPANDPPAATHGASLITLEQALTLCLSPNLRDQQRLRMFPLDHPQVWVAAATRAHHPALVRDLWRLAARGPHAFTTSANRPRTRVILDATTWARLATQLPGLRVDELAALAAAAATIPEQLTPDLALSGYTEIAATIAALPARARAAFFHAGRPRGAVRAPTEVYCAVLTKLADRNDPVAIAETRHAPGRHPLRGTDPVLELANELDATTWSSTELDLLAQVAATLDGTAVDVVTCVRSACA